MRPFTNNLEAMALAVLLAVVVPMAARVDDATDARETNPPSGRAGMPGGDSFSLLLIGATCSVGVFVRFTFVFFAFLTVVVLLWQRWKEIDFNMKRLVRDVLWMATSFLLIMFFRWFYQGGLLPSLLHRNKYVAQSPRAFIYSKNYMPPTFLTLGAKENGVWNAAETESGGTTCSDDLQHETGVTLDLRGTDSPILLEVLRQWLPCDSPHTGGRAPGVSKLSNCAGNAFLHLVSPPAVVLPLMEQREFNSSTATMKWQEYLFELT